MTILATLILTYWILQGARIAAEIASEGYSPVWSGLAAIMALLLLVPLALLWL